MSCKTYLSYFCQCLVVVVVVCVCETAVLLTYISEVCGHTGCVTTSILWMQVHCFMSMWMQTLHNKKIFVTWWISLA